MNKSSMLKQIVFEVTEMLLYLNEDFHLWIKLNN